MPKTYPKYRQESSFFDSYSNTHEISKVQFVLIIKTFFYLLTRRLLEGHVYKLPFGVGLIGCLRQPISKVTKGVFDYQLYKTTGIKRYHQNTHSHNQLVRIRWILTKHTDIVPKWFQTFFKFEPTRDWKREIATKIKSNFSILKYQPYEQ